VRRRRRASPPDCHQTDRWEHIRWDRQEWSLWNARAGRPTIPPSRCQSRRVQPRARGHVAEVNQHVPEVVIVPVEIGVAVPRALVIRNTVRRAYVQMLPVAHPFGPPVVIPRWQHGHVVHLKHHGAGELLPHLAFAGRVPRSIPRPLQRRHQQGRQYCYYCNDNEKLYKGKCPSHYRVSHNKEPRAHTP
jgi:hypothetical protein